MKKYDINGSNIVFQWIIYMIVVIILLIIVLPFLYVLMTSFATREETLSRGFFLIPHHWSWGAYRYLLQNDNFMTSLKNAVIITIIGVAINVVMTSLMAYGLSKQWLVGKRTMNFLIMFTMIFSAGMIPTYIVVQVLGLLDSYWALWLSTAIAPFNLIVMRSFFQNTPKELEEAAQIDGCGEFRFFWRMVIPLSMPAIATFTLFYMVQNWNTYFNAILYINDQSKWPLQVFLRQMLIEAQNTDTSFQVGSNGYMFGPPVKMAAIIVAALPLIIVYPFLQKYFNKGMLLGSVKG